MSAARAPLAEQAESTNSMKRTGTLEPLRDASGALYYAGKVRLRDGSRARVEIPEAKRHDERAARRYFAWAQEREDEHGTLHTAKLAGRAKREAKSAGAAGETCDAWYERFAKVRAVEVGSAEDDAWRWAKWISPHIGAKPIRDVTADDVENVRDALNSAVRVRERRQREG